MNARFLMMDGVRRLMIIANDLTMSSFINYTGCNEFAAFVSPSKDMPHIINIGAKFEYIEMAKKSSNGKGFSCCYFYVMKMSIFSGIMGIIKKVYGRVTGLYNY